VTAFTDEDGEATLIGEERSFINNIQAAHISVPEKYIVQIFQSSFNPLNLPKLHRNGLDLADKPDEVQLSSTDQMSIKKSSRFGQGLREITSDLARRLHGLFRHHISAIQSQIPRSSISVTPFLPADNRSF